MVMPYGAIQFTVLHKVKTFAAGSSKTGISKAEQFLSNRRVFYLFGKCFPMQNVTNLAGMLKV